MTAEVLVDTSALYAVLDRDDLHHGEARAGWDSLLDGVAARRCVGVVHGGVLTETSALVQRRLGLDALRALHDVVIPVLECQWVDADLHARAVSALLAAARHDISLVDWTSFTVMRERGIEHALAFDAHFAEQGFREWR